MPRRRSAPRRGRRLIVLLVLAIIAAGAGWYWGSPQWTLYQPQWTLYQPQWTLYQMRAAVRDRDAAKLAGYVDFAALRASVKAQMQARIDAETSRNEDLGALGAILGRAVLGPLVDKIVSPDGLEAMLAGKGDAHGPVRHAAISVENARILHEGLSGFRLHDETQAESAGDMVFRRYGMGWKLVSIDIH